VVSLKMEDASLVAVWKELNGLMVMARCWGLNGAGDVGRHLGEKTSCVENYSLFHIG